ncbi:MAG: hypothetical protein ACJASQ_000204 [Crocinitomicaceae bacterium]|jgi:hypothetical protein
MEKETKKQGTFGWGKGITVALVLFMGFILTMAGIMMSKGVELETEDYYLKEMAYEQEIQALKNANNLDEKISIETDDEFLIVQIPDGKFKDVRLELFRPNDKDQDKIYDIKDSQIFMIGIDELKHGQYNVAISYLESGIVCLQKEKIFIQ